MAASRLTFSVARRARQQADGSRPRRRGTDGHPPSLSAQSHHQRRAAIEAARLFARVVELRPLLAVADRAEAVGADAAARQVVADRGGAAFAERQVVLGRADVAGVAFDLDPQRRVLLQRAIASSSTRVASGRSV